jgi:hypothetical protein
MSAEELREFLAAMEVVRQANAAFSDAARDFFEQDDDLDEDRRFADPRKSVTLH